MSTQDTTSESEYGDTLEEAQASAEQWRLAEARSQAEWRRLGAENDTLRTHYEQMKKERDVLDEQGELMTRDRDAWRETAYAREREADNLRSQLTEQRAVIEAARAVDDEAWGNTADEDGPAPLVELHLALSALSQEETP